MRLFIASIIVIVLAIPRDSMAETGFDFGFVRPAMTEQDFRQAFDNPGIAVVCTGEDRRLPSSIVKALTVPPAQMAVGAKRCRHLKEDGEGGWKGIDVKLAEVCCADLFVTLIRDGDDNRIALVNARAKADTFMALMRHMAVKYGPYDSYKDNVATWKRDGQTAYLIQSDGEAYLMMLDDHLDGRLPR
ncbi:MAG: hypothetical protein HQL42_18305 [Alphaproteobacteria bacterium]|nr:hypothetical protein [Alphaproteobacteria bacterium]